MPCSAGLQAALDTTRQPDQVGEEKESQRPAPKDEAGICEWGVGVHLTAGLVLELLSTPPSSAVITDPEVCLLAGWRALMAPLKGQQAHVTGTQQPQLSTPMGFSTGRAQCHHYARKGRRDRARDATVHSRAGGRPLAGKELGTKPRRQLLGTGGVGRQRILCRTFRKEHSPAGSSRPVRP